MKVRVISSFCLKAGQDVLTGDVLDLPDDEARRLIRMRYVVENHDPQPAAEPPTIADAGEIDVPEESALSLDPEPENHDPQPAGKGRGKKEK